MPGAAPFFSVVTPVRDGGTVFETCLAGLVRSRFRDFELIVVDDGSRDDSAGVASRAGARVVVNPESCGPAAARNRGAAEARGDWLLFLDADCEPNPDTVERLAASLTADPDLAAVIGSYDDSPAAPGLVAQAKNLLHHWMHHQAAGEAETFWSGCGAIRRTTFEAVGGFDAARYPGPSIEDVELGFRLRAGGHRIELVPEMQVKHHKAWTFVGLVRSDLVERALPWVDLGFERGGLGNRLNVDRRSRLSAVAALALVAGLAGAVVRPLPGLVTAAAAAGFLVVAHAGLYRLYARRGGLRLLVVGTALHWLYHLYASAALAYGTARHLLRRARGRATPAREGAR